MVQRKASNKLGIQADSKNYVKSEKRSMVLKPSSSQHQDIRHRGGAELKKKMKKSRLIKLSDLESLGSSPMTQAKSSSSKPPTDASSAAATPQKPSLIKISDSSPNYMKPTSSSDARKEHSQVRPHGSQTGCHSKSTSRRNSNYSKTCSASGHKPQRTLTKTSSLKPVRTLTKTSSMKLPRPSMKKSPGVASHPSVNVDRATCSSTLKDSKFPAFVMLHPGGTESEGTSVVKVCPYTYCSLNGHHHAPSPPLKHFLSARRCLLKTQKSMRLKGLSPLQTKPPGERKKEIDTGQMAFNGNPTTQESDLAGLTVSPVIEEVGMDFFVEIYAKPREDPAKSIERSIQDWYDDTIIDFGVNPDVLNDITSSVTDGAEIDIKNDDGKVDESPSDESAYSETSFKDNLDQNSDFLVAKMNNLITSPERDQLVEVDNRDYHTCLIQETGLECCCIGTESEQGSPAETELDEYVSEAIDMDWEEGQVDTPHLGDEAEYSTLTDKESDLMNICLPECKIPGLHSELVFKPENIVNSSEEFPVEEIVLQQVHEEDTESFSMEYGDDDSDSDGEDQGFETDVSSNVSGKEWDIPHRLNQDLLSSTGVAFEEPATSNEETDCVPKPDNNFINSMVSSASVKDPLEELAASCEDKNGDSDPDIFLQGYPLLKDDEPTCITDVADKTLKQKQESRSLQVDLEIDQSAVTDDIDAMVRSQLHKLEDTESVFESQSLESVDLETDKDADTSNPSQDQALTSADAGSEAEGKEVEDANTWLGIQISESYHDFSEEYHDAAKEDHSESHEKCPEIEASQHDVYTEDDKWGQQVIDENHSLENQDHLSDDQSDINHIEEEQDFSEKALGASGEMSILGSTDSEEHGDLERNKSSLAEKSIEEDEKMQVEENVESDAAAETRHKEINITGSKEDETITNTGSDSSQQLPKTSSNLKRTIRSKRPINDWEEPRKFNPREPRYLPIEPDLEAEKIDLRHQLMDERKNAEEWMLDYALQQTVTKLAPARKQRVALLVEAFETVMPVPKYETHLRHTTAAFSHARPIQACN